ncbi:MAG: DUF1007 family protein [Pseudomonadota bacterium]
MFSCLLAALPVLWAAPAVQSHPHVFVDAETGFHFNADGQLVGLRITWTYDAFTSLMLFDILDLDRDNDGALDEADRAAIVAGETTWAEDYRGDTYLEMNGADIRLARPEGGRAWMTADRISVAFDLPLAAPLAPGAEAELVLRLYDPSYYYAYTVTGLKADVPDACTAEVVPFKPDTAAAELQAKLAALSREETPTQDNVGRLFADEVRLSCA